MLKFLFVYHSGLVFLKILEVRQKVFDACKFFIFERDFPSALPGVYEQIVRETEKLLDDRGLNKLTPQQKDMLKRQIEEIASPDNTVFKLICEYPILLFVVNHNSVQEISRLLYICQSPASKKNQTQGVVVLF